MFHLFEFPLKIAPAGLKHDLCFELNFVESGTVVSPGLGCRAAEQQR